MSEEELDELIANLVDLSPDEVNSELDKYDLTPEELDEVNQMVNAVRDSDKLADDNAALAKNMANEDGTEVTVTEEDMDNDGDADTVSIEKTKVETDDLPNIPEEDMNAIKSIIDDTDETDSSDLGNSDESGDTPHDAKDDDEEVSDVRKKRIEHMKSNWGKTDTQKKREKEATDKKSNSTNNIAKLLSGYKY